MFDCLPVTENSWENEEEADFSDLILPIKDLSMIGIIIWEVLMNN